MGKFQAIREIQNKYGHNTPTKTIIKKVKEEFGLTVNDQNVCCAIGSQAKRNLMSSDGGQIYETKQFIKKHFDNDVDQLLHLARLLR